MKNTMDSTFTVPESFGVAISAYAKVNLTLELLGMLEGGYHAIRSVVVPVELHDTVELRSAPSGNGISLEVVADGVDISRIGPEGDNLAVRAARLFQERTGTSFPLAIRVVKRIPIGGGLGGGSADAAAVLRGLASLAGQGAPSTGELMDMGAELGSDIPSLVLGGTVLMEGRGEKARPLLADDGRSPIPPLRVVLANPGVFVSTAEAYRASNETLTSAAISDTIFNSNLRRLDFGSVAALLFNGLEKAVFRLHPEVAALAARMRDGGTGAVLMSGSGATVFALAADDAEAEGVMRALPAGCWKVLTRLLPDGVMAAHGPLEA